MTKKDKLTYTMLEVLSAMMVAAGFVFAFPSSGNTRVAFVVMILAGLIMFWQSRKDRRKIRGINMAEDEAINRLHLYVRSDQDLVNN